MFATVYLMGHIRSTRKRSAAACVLSPFILLSSLLAQAGSNAIPPPAWLKDRESYEIGDLIYQVIPDEGRLHVPWQQMANSGIRWVTSGYETMDAGIHYRQGMVRVNVMGRLTTALRQKEEELEWQITYSTTDLPKWGAEAVSLKPGWGPGTPCFGSLYDGCRFEIEESLLSTPLNVEVICNDYWRGKVYRLTGDGKRPSIAILETDGGSLGVSSKVWLINDYEGRSYNHICDPFSDDD